MKATLAALALLAFAAPAAGETRNVSVANFHAIEASGQFRIEFTQGPRASLTFDGAASDIDRLRVSSRNGELSIEHRCTFFCSRNLHVVARVTAPNLDELDLAKGVEFTAEGVDAGDLSIDIAMGATAHLSGTCRNLDANAAMGAVLDARALECRTASIDAAMGGVARVSAAESIDASAAMGGDIRVSGNPERRRQSASMGGNIDVR
jgi:hypothetical protein